MSDNIIACTAEDIFWLEHCRGCFEQFQDTPPRVAHEETCVAYRDHVIEEKLGAQARDDGKVRDEEGEWR